MDVVKNTENIQPFVKMGFFDPNLVEEVFKEVHPDKSVQDQQTLTWIEQLNQRFEENVGKLDVEPAEIIQQINEIFASKKLIPTIKDEISNNLTILNLHQSQMK